MTSLPSSLLKPSTYWKGNLTDTNAIFAEPIKNRMGPAILQAYTKLHTYLTNRGFQPCTHWLDNEASQASQALKDFDTTNNIDFQLVPPHIHRRNAAE